MKLKELFEAKERSILSVMGKQEDPYPRNFSCFNNNLTSLEGAPSVVKGNFSCFNNNLTSLEGAPSAVKGDFYCSYNNLTSLEGAPSVGAVVSRCSTAGHCHSPLSICLTRRCALSPTCVYHAEFFISVAD